MQVSHVLYEEHGGRAHAVEPEVDTCPAGQLIQDVAPLEPIYCPAGQSRQDDWPVDGWYSPPSFPQLSPQYSHEVDPVERANLPAAQLIQLVDVSVEGLYCPAAHA